MNARDPRRYVLSDQENEELLRLGFQHAVWSDETADLCRRAGFAKGQTLLDLGSGPGFLTFDLATLAGPAGQVVALDTSERFVEHLRASAARQKLHNITAKVADITALPMENESVDGAIVRWVLMFIENAEAAIAEIARVLKPGGVLATMEYFNFRSISLWPHSEAFQTIYRAVYELIRTHGGDADRGAQLPDLLTAHGFTLRDIRPILRAGRPGSPLWQWLEETGKNHGNLVETGLITTAELEAYYRDWSARSADPAAFFTAPPVLTTIGVKTP